MADPTTQEGADVANRGTNSGTASELPVLIIGSGTAGLALAQGLRKDGIECIVFERRPGDAHERDWNMGLHWGAPVLKSLMPDEWWSRIQSLQVDPNVPTKDIDTLSILQGDTGETIFSFSMGPFYRLRRSKLRALLSQHLDIRYNKRLIDISYPEDGKGVTVQFEDGTTATGGLLVGADGARSTTRQCLLGPELGAINRLSYAATFIQQTFTKEQALYLRSFHPLFLASAHPSDCFAFFGMHSADDAGDPSTWTFFFYISWHSSLEEQEQTKSWTDKQRVQQQKELAKNFCDPWKSALEWTSEDAKAWYLGLTDWDPSLPDHRWNNHDGRVTMVGDAVHPMTYQRGQGLNHSLTDAGQLRDALLKVKEGGEQKQLIEAFEEEMIRRSGTEVRESTLNTTMLHDWEKVRQSPVFTKGMRKND